ncbi:unnamed protein product [Toxocara canis]|uniref:Uncharacterized protein n=1 Tax=Toxocara canis TaxID=6265 RepID=A0A183VAP0_TOXCA|nr:unnamed protein product [Toxocara canis]
MPAGKLASKNGQHLHECGGSQEESLELSCGDGDERGDLVVGSLMADDGEVDFGFGEEFLCFADANVTVDTVDLFRGNHLRYHVRERLIT